MISSHRRRARYTLRYRIPEALRALRESWRDSAPREWKPGGLTVAEFGLLTQHMEAARETLRRHGLDMFDRIGAP